MSSYIIFYDMGFGDVKETFTNFDTARAYLIALEVTCKAHQFDKPRMYDPMGRCYDLYEDEWVGSEQ